MAIQTLRGRLGPVLLEVAKQAFSWGLAAYVVSLFGLADYGFPWAIVFFVTAVFLSYALFDVVYDYALDVAGRGDGLLGKDRNIRRRKAVRYLALVVGIISVPSILFVVEYNGQPLTEHLLDLLRKDDTRFARRALREVMESTSDYEVKEAAVKAIGMTKARDALFELFTIAKSMEGSYEVPGRPYRPYGLFCEFAERIGAFGGITVAFIVGEVRAGRTVRKGDLPKAASLARQFNSQFGPQFKKLRAEFADLIDNPDTTRAVERELLEVEDDLVKRLTDIEGRHLAEFTNKEQYKRSYLDLLLVSLLYVEFKRESDAVYGLARDIGFDPRQPSETRKRAIRLFAQHGTLRDVPLLLNIAKNDSASSIRLTATEVLPSLGIKAFGSDKDKHRMRVRCD